MQLAQPMVVTEPTGKVTPFRVESDIDNPALSAPPREPVTQFVVTDGSRDVAVDLTRLRPSALVAFEQKFGKGVLDILAELAETPGSLGKVVEPMAFLCARCGVETPEWFAENLDFDQVGDVMLYLTKKVAAMMGQ